MIYRIFSIFIMMLMTSLCFAKTLDLYDAPQKDAKVIGKIDAAAGIIPIFTPKDSSWIKVGDPRNGNVGWIKNSDLNAAGSSTKLTCTQQITGSGKGTNGYQIIQFGTPSQEMTEDQKKMIKQIQERQQAIQKNAQEMMHDMFRTMDQPMIMPIIVLPESSTKK